MSADNWTVCPACLKRAEEKVTQLRNQIDTGYGTLPRDEWMELHDQLGAAEKAVADPRGHFTTFREDHDLEMDAEGNFSIHYRGVCSERHKGCGYRFEYQSSGFPRGW